MPEQLTQHPEVTIEVLRSAGARCGERAPQEILLTCPSARFCKLPGGEVCIYGLAEAGQMTQVSAHELRALVPAGPAASQPLPPPLGTVLLVGAVSLFVGLAAGAMVVRFGRRWALARQA